MAGRSILDDPLKAFRFRVEIANITRAGFTEVNGLQGQVEEIEYREGGMNDTVQKSPGLVTWDNLTLRRGQLVFSSQGGDDDIREWWNQMFRMYARGSSVEIRREVDIVQYHKDGREARRWRLYECFPKRYKPFSDLNGTGNEDSYEEVELVHEGCELIA